MDISLYCPGCDHALCLSCLKSTWSLIPRQTRLVGTLRPDGARIVVCCACGGGNDKAYWKEARRPEPRYKVKQPDLFVDHDT
jgi:hypothetical protein